MLNPSNSTIRFEAEELQLNGYGLDIRDTPFASNGELISLISPSDAGQIRSDQGTATGTFNGQTGQYNVLISYYDEDDGEGELSFELNNNVLDQWSLDQSPGGGFATADNQKTRTVASGITLNAGDIFTIRGNRDQAEYARVDYIEFAVIDINDAPIAQNVIGVNAIEDGSPVIGCFDADDIDSDDDPSTLTYTITSQPSEGSVIVNPLPPPISLEAEDLELNGYILDPRNYPFASGDGLISLVYDADGGVAPSPTGTATGTFGGLTGKYDIVISYHDEQDGEAQLSFALNNTVVEQWTLDQSPGGVVPTSDNLMRRTVSGITLNTGDTFTLEGIRDNEEYARIDSIEFIPVPTFTFDPEQDFQDLAVGETRDVSFHYTATDSHGAVSNEATATVTVTGTNDIPVAVDDTKVTDEDTAITFAAAELLENDTDIDASDTLSVISVDGSNASFDGTNITYNPNEQFESLAVGETATDSFEYTISDGNGGTATATVEVTINGVNDIPIAVDDAKTTDEDTAITFASSELLVNDTDIDTSDVLSVISVDDTNTQGLVSFDDTNITYDPNGQFEYLSAGETATDTFYYTISDGNGGTDMAAVTVTITGKDELDAINDTLPEIQEGVSLTINFNNFLNNDINPSGTPLEIINFSQPGNGSLVTNSDDTVTYNPNPFFVGNDTFTYTISDGNGDTDTATVTVPVLNTDPGLFRETEFNNCFTPEDCMRLMEAGVPGVRMGEADLVTRDQFGVAPNANLSDDSNPHVRVEGRLGRTDNQDIAEVDIFGFELNVGEILTLDIDFGARYDKNGVFTDEKLNTHLFVFDPSITNNPFQAPIISPSNSPTAGDIGNPIDPGSFRPTDPFVEFTATETGTYYVGVATEDTVWRTNQGAFREKNNPVGDFEGDYVLHASLTLPPVVI